MHRATVCAWLLAGLVSRPGVEARAQTAERAPDSVLVGHWSAAIGGAMWDLLINRDRSYWIGAVTAAGDTLVVSMGRWTVRRAARGAKDFCLTPAGRGPICGPLAISRPDDPALSEWRFSDAEGSPFTWLAYRRGYAPWDTLPVSWRGTDVYALSEVTVPPRIVRCGAPLDEPPPASPSPLPVQARFVVEPDGTVSGVEVVDPPDAAVRVRVAGIVRSCRLVPGPAGERPGRPGAGRAAVRVAEIARQTVATRVAA